MSEIIIQGIKVDTKDIWEIKDLSTSRLAGFSVHLIGGDVIKVTKGIPYESYPYEIRDAHAPYDRLRREIEAKWKADKTDLPIFKL
jgi:hypothetical protein